jgi:hypothetical protein
MLVEDELGKDPAGAVRQPSCKLLALSVSGSYASAALAWRARS